MSIHKFIYILMYINTNNCILISEFFPVVSIHLSVVVHVTSQYALTVRNNIRKL